MLTHLPRECLFPTLSVNVFLKLPSKCIILPALSCPFLDENDELRNLFSPPKWLVFLPIYLWPGPSLTKSSRNLVLSTPPWPHHGSIAANTHTYPSLLQLFQEKASLGPTSPAILLSPYPTSTQRKSLASMCRLFPPSSHLAYLSMEKV